MKRRDLLKLSAGFFISVKSPEMLASQKQTNVTRIVIIGAGQGGISTVGHLINQNSNVQVTIFDLNFKANLKKIKFIEGISVLEYRTVLSSPKVRIDNEAVTTIDPVRKCVKTSTGRIEYYDHLVLSPGISYKTDKLIGFSGNTMRTVSAWLNPQNESLLFKRLKALDNGELVVISAPPLPYRYPVGPYQRATRIANYLKSNKPRSKLLILDEKDSFPGQIEYLEYWRREYPAGMTEWVPASQGGSVTRYSEKHKILLTGGGKVKAGLVNYIPPQQAADIAVENYLVNQHGWCPVHHSSMESTLAKDLYIIGDANSITIENKTAFNAISQGKIAAEVIMTKSS